MCLSDRVLHERLKYQLNNLSTEFNNLLQKRRLIQIHKIIKRPYNKLFSGGFTFLGYTKAEKVTDRALSWVESHANEDFFLWIHYMETHRPYGVHDDNPEYLESKINEKKIKTLMKIAGTQPSEITDEERVS
jgi:hypothetical protein